jgi:hypothetical protein
MLRQNQIKGIYCDKKRELFASIKLMYIIEIWADVAYIGMLQASVKKQHIQ